LSYVRVLREQRVHDATGSSRDPVDGDLSEAVLET